LGKIDAQGRFFWKALLAFLHDRSQIQLMRHPGHLNFFIGGAMLSFGALLLIG